MSVINIGPIRKNDATGEELRPGWEQMRTALNGLPLGPISGGGEHILTLGMRTVPNDIPSDITTLVHTYTTHHGATAPQARGVSGKFNLNPTLDPNNLFDTGTKEFTVPSTGFYQIHFPLMIFEWGPWISEAPFDKVRMGINAWVNDVKFLLHNVKPSSTPEQDASSGTSFRCQPFSVGLALTEGDTVGLGTRRIAYSSSIATKKLHRQEASGTFAFGGPVNHLNEIYVLKVA